MASHISKAACFWLWLLGDRRDGHFDLSCHVRLSTRISTRPAFDLSVVDLSSTSTCCCFCFCFYCLCCIALPEKLNRARKNYAATWAERTRKDRFRRTWTALTSTRPLAPTYTTSPTTPRFPPKPKCVNPHRSFSIIFLRNFTISLSPISPNFPISIPSPLHPLTRAAANYGKQYPFKLRSFR